MAAEMLERYDTKMARCGLVHWPEYSKVLDYTDEEKPGRPATCKRCARLTAADAARG